MWSMVTWTIWAAVAVPVIEGNEPNAQICEPYQASDIPVPKGDVVRQRVFQFENSKTRVWKTSLRKGEPLRLHHNPKGRVLVPLADADVTETDSAGHRNVVVMKAGRSYWRPADKAGSTQSSIIEANADLDVMVIEIKK